MTAVGFDGVERRGLMFVLSSPSGAGKTTLSRMLIERTPGLKMSVSATTRPMRPVRSTAATISSSTSPNSRRWRTRANCSNGPPCSTIATARRARRSRAALSAGPGRAVRHRLAGHAAIARKGLRPTSSASSSCRRRRPISRSGCTPARRIPTRSFAGRMRPRQPRTQPLGRIRLHRRQPEHRRTPLPRCSRSSSAEQLKRDRRTGPDRVRSRPAAPAGQIISFTSVLRASRQPRQQFRRCAAADRPARADRAVRPRHIETSSSGSIDGEGRSL